MTLNLGWLLVLIVLCVVIGFLAGVCATWPRAAKDDSRPGGQFSPMPSPRPGYAGFLLTAEHEPEPFPTTPTGIWSPHAARLAAHEREIRQMITAAEDWPYR